MPVVDAEVPGIAAAELIGPLADQGDLHVLPGPATDKVHRDHRGGRDGFLDRGDDFRQLALEGGAVDANLVMAGAEECRGAGGIGQLIVAEAGAVADAERGPVASVLGHQAEQ